MGASFAVTDPPARVMPSALKTIGATLPGPPLLTFPFNTNVPAPASSVTPPIPLTLPPTVKSLPVLVRVTAPWRW
jgi:hypothetical protein